MKYILGEKISMMEVFDENGIVHPVTVVSAGPIIVLQIKTVKNDGYAAIQVGYGTKSAKNTNKPEAGHTKGVGPFRYFREIRFVNDKEVEAFKIGDSIDAGIFKAGDTIEVSGVSKGKGFQGVVKRHGFGGGRRTHGQKHSEREPGAIGGGARAGGRVAKGMRMAGRMGGDRITVKNLKVVQVEAGNLILIRGAVPGRRGTLLEVKG